MAKIREDSAWEWAHNAGEYRRNWSLQTGKRSTLLVQGVVQRRQCDPGKPYAVSLRVFGIDPYTVNLGCARTSQGGKAMATRYGRRRAPVVTPKPARRKKRRR